LTESLIAENKFEKAEEILDLSLAEMPIEEYGHYGICLGYPEYYYKINKVEKAREVSETLIKIFQEKLMYYSRFDEAWLNLTFDEIERNLNMYRSVLSDIDANEKDKTYLKNTEEDFINHVKLFESLLE
jgi:tetratricopeptide (TPR) repeat protein